MPNNVEHFFFLFWVDEWVRCGGGGCGYAWNFWLHSWLCAQESFFGSAQGSIFSASYKVGSAVSKQGPDPWYYPLCESLFLCVFLDLGVIPNDTWPVQPVSAWRGGTALAQPAVTGTTQPSWQFSWSPVLLMEGNGDEHFFHGHLYVIFVEKLYSDSPVLNT